MSTLFLILAALLFTSTLGIHLLILNLQPIDRPLYTREPGVALLPWVVGLVLPVIVYSKLIEVHWIVLFLVNFLAAYFIGPAITKGYLERFSSAHPGKDLVTSFVLGIIALIVGLATL